MGACTSKKSRHDTTSSVGYMYTIICIYAYSVHLTAYIWSKNAHNLFDFESNQFTKREIEIDYSTRLATFDNELLALNKNVI
jgi:hypothetical protein